VKDNGHALGQPGKDFLEPRARFLQPVENAVRIVRVRHVVARAERW
jgi:hypothetical protein